MARTEKRGVIIMTEKRRLQIAAAVAAKDDTVVRASVRLGGEGKAVIDKVTVKASAPWETKVLGMLARTIEQMANAGISGAIFIGDRAMPRYLQAVKMTDRHNGVEMMTLPWMKVNPEVLESYQRAARELLAALRRARNAGIVAIVRGMSELWKVKLEGESEVLLSLEGKAVDIRAGISEEFGIRVTGNRRFYGRVIVKSLEGSFEGKIIDESLSGKALEFLTRARKAVHLGFDQLPGEKFGFGEISEEVSIF